MSFSLAIYKKHDSVVQLIASCRGKQIQTFPLQSGSLERAQKLKIQLKSFSFLLRVNEKKERKPEEN